MALTVGSLARRSLADDREAEVDEENGLLTGGFVVVAWPAKYGNSGIMTFATNHRGLVYQKDFGPETEQAVAAIQAYEPDESWTPTGDVMTEPDPE